MALQQELQAAIADLSEEELAEVLNFIALLRAENEMPQECILQEQRAALEEAWDEEDEWIDL